MGQKLVKKKRKHSGLVLVTILVLLVAAGAIFHQPIKNQLNSWKVLPEPERLTELYFNNPNHLPTTYTPAVGQNVSVVIHNLEYETWKYHYTVKTIAAGKTTYTYLGTTTLTQNQYKTLPLYLDIPDIGPRVQVQVCLVNPSQCIDYWVNRSGS